MRVKKTSVIEQPGQSVESLRYQVLFEHCARELDYDLDFSRTGNVFDDKRTDQLYCLWLSGHQQGVVDQATADGVIRL